MGFHNNSHAAKALVALWIDDSLKKLLNTLKLFHFDFLATIFFKYNEFLLKTLIIALY